MQRPAMGDVADVALEERRPAGGVQRFEHHGSAGPHFLRREFEEAKQVRGLEVLDDLRGEEPSQRLVRKRVQVADGVRLLDSEAAGPADLHHLAVQIDAPGPDAARVQQVDELAASTADIQYVILNRLEV